MASKNNTSLIPHVIESLRAVAMVPLEMDGVADKNKITMSRLRLEQIMGSYDIIYGLVNKCWSNLPDPPCDEKTSISWDGATPNTFVHVWSIMELERTDLSWAVGSRNCSDYCRAMNMQGALDMYLYRPESMTPSQITDIERDIFKPTLVNKKTNFCSHYDFCMSMLVDTGPKVLNVSEMEEIARSRRTGSRRPAIGTKVVSRL
ncbi:hypothetical protein FNAPI_10789 [Fusarium napiforme]|uniref:Uncharacterized protein n=1 Tax=Fusarium napiforme TaxID=42672 RepID=A0A8H5ILR2_9HYPO|nr:hypothetical protein FNAPI_10789 [Fusarium napiforme]